MDYRSYEKHLIGELCWDCGEATRRSSLTQRQCPKCRCKWSYRRAQVRWSLLKAFCLGSSAHQAARTLGCDYGTAHGCFEQLREGIRQLAQQERQALLGEIELDESYFGGRRKGMRGRGAAGKVPVFGLLERGGKVYSLVVPDCTKQTLMGLIERHSVKGSVYYTDEFKSYRDLKRFGKHLPVNHSKTFGNRRSHINGIEGFWSFAKHLHYKTRGVDPGNFPQYLQEYEFRYNHRQDDLLATLYEHIIKPATSAKIHTTSAMQNH